MLTKCLLIILIECICKDANKREFICVNNLQVLFRGFEENLEKICEILIGKEGELLQDRKKLSDVQIQEVYETPSEFQNYLPWIRIYDFPDQFMSLVPTWDAPKIVEEIKKEYETQFSKVKDRLSLHLGIVFFHRKTPLFSVMDAGKRMLASFESKSKDYEATVIKHSSNSNKDVLMTFKINSGLLKDKIFTWSLNYATGDPNVDDKYHPYIRLAKDIDISDRDWKIEDPKSLCVHVKDLRKGDKILVKPSLFSFIFLESNIIRFEAGKEVHTIDDFKKMLKIWNLLINLFKEKKLTQTKLKSIETLLTSKLRIWGVDDSFKRLVKATLKRDFALKEDEDRFKMLEDSILSGLFFKTLELNLRILKRKLEVLS